ncbi:MAG: hypothetical protein KC933_21665 [Myxococcales bacterium]|nr:hypothetical protein [Myxococcales bacterium]
MTDILHKLAAVSNLQAQDAASDLNKLADRQQEKVYEKRAVRDVQEYYDTVMSDDVVTFDELQNLHEMRSEIGATTDNFWNSDGKVNGFSSADGTSWSYDSAQVNSHGNGNNDGFSIDLREDADNPLKNSTAKKGLEAIDREIDGVMDDLEDDESLLQFEIQVGTSKMTSAEQSRAGAEKRLEDHRKTLQQKWEG